MVDTVDDEEGREVGATEAMMTMAQRVQSLKVRMMRMRVPVVEMEGRGDERE